MTQDKKQITEQDIVTLRCPCCGELIPARIEIEGTGVQEGYVSIDGATMEFKTPFPDVKICIGVDLLGLRDGGLRELLDGRSDIVKKYDQERKDFENNAKLERDANHSD